jgi:DNA polymerase III epsilon subunit-like protein
MNLELNLQDPVVVIDTETGGLNPSEAVEWNLDRSNIQIGDKIAGKFIRHAAPILEIGAIILNPFNLEEVAEYHSLCGPEVNEPFDKFMAKCTPEALRINGFKDRTQELKKAKPTSQVLSEFINWLPKTKGGRPKFIPAGQNARYDIDMINHACMRFGVNFQITHYPLELMSFSLLFFGLKDTEIVANHRLTTVAAALGVSTEKAHTALADIRMTAECLRRIFSRFSRS